MEGREEGREGGGRRRRRRKLIVIWLIKTTLKAMIHVYYYTQQSYKGIKGVNTVYTWTNDKHPNLNANHH